MIELLIKGLKLVDINEIDNVGILLMKGLYELTDNTDKNYYKFKAALSDGKD